MSDRKLSYSFKGGTGYEAPLLSIGGDSVEELNFQLQAIMGAGTLQLATEVALRFQAEYRDGRHAPGQQGQQQPPQQSPQGQQPPQGAHQGYHQPPNQQPDPWGGQGAPQDPWANQQPAQQTQGGGYQQGQQSQAQQQPQWQPGNAPPTCQCGQQMEYKMAGANKDKPVWRCKDWRWNNGNPTTNHDQIWVEGTR